MITIFHSALSETLKDLAKNQNNAVRIPLTVYFDRVEEFKFSTGYTVHTLEPVKVSVRDYYWINKPPKPMMYRFGYYINKKQLPFLTVFSFGYKMKFSDEFYLKVRSPYKRRFFFGDRLNAHYRAGYKVRLGYTQFKNTYRTGYKVKNFKSDEFILNYKFPYLVERIGTFNIRLSTGYNVQLTSQEEYTYRFWYRNSVSKFIFPRKYNQNAAGANTSIAELIKPWKVIKQKDGTSGIRISLDKEKLDLGSDGLRIYLNMPPKYINYCVLLRDKFSKLPDSPSQPVSALPIIEETPAQPPAPPAPPPSQPPAPPPPANNEGDGSPPSYNPDDSPDDTPINGGGTEGVAPYDQSRENNP